MAQQRRRKSPAVEKHQHLLAGGEGLADGLLHGAGNTTVQRATFHVQAQETGLFGTARSLVQTQQPITAGVGVMQAFQGGRRRAQYNRDVFLAGSHQRQVAGVVAQAFLLLIGAVVLFIDDDQPGVFHRGEQRRAGADNNVGFAVACRQPGLQALTVVDRRVHQGDARVETLFETRQGLRAQVDLGDQHQCLLTGLQGFADQLQIDFGLAAASHAGQQERMEAVEARADCFIRSALLGVQRQFRLGQPVLVTCVGSVLADLYLHQALGQQQVKAVLAQHQFAQQLMGDAMGVLGQGGQGFTLARGAGDARVIQACAGRDRPEALLARFGRLALTQQHGQRPAQGVAQAVLVILRVHRHSLNSAGGSGGVASRMASAGLSFSAGTSLWSVTSTRMPIISRRPNGTRTRMPGCNCDRSTPAGAR